MLRDKKSCKLWPCSSQCGARSPRGNLDTKGLIWPNQCSECPQFSQKGGAQWNWYERNQMSFIFLTTAAWPRCYCSCYWNSKPHSSAYLWWSGFTPKNLSKTKKNLKKLLCFWYLDYENYCFSFHAWDKFRLVILPRDPRSIECFQGKYL